MNERPELLTAQGRRVELCRERALLILRVTRETWRDPVERLAQIEGEAEHFYFIATGEQVQGEHK